MNSTSAASRWTRAACRCIRARLRRTPRRCAWRARRITWIRDTRDSPIDAHRGTYTSFQGFLSGTAFGAQAQFSRLDLSNSSYYQFDKGRFVLARNTRYGQERVFGNPEDDTDSPPRAALFRRRHFAARLRRELGRAARPGDGLSHRRGRRARSTAPNCACRRPRCPGSATPSASCSSTTWAMSSPMPAMPGPALSGFASRIAEPARSRSPPTIPHYLRLPAQIPRRAFRDPAASTTSLMRRGWVCATIRRSGQSGWTSAIT